MKLHLTDEDHDRLNRMRNIISVYTGYGMILVLAVAGFMAVVGMAVKAVGLAWE